MCYTTTEDYAVLNCNSEHVGSLEDHGSISPLIRWSALYLRDLDRDHEQVEGSVKEDRGVIRQCWTIASTVSGQEVARILWTRGIGYVKETKLQSLKESSVLPCHVDRGFPETNQVILIVGLQIIGDSWNHELAENSRIQWVL